ncbi:transcriptional regulator [Sulfodiicoccus acidiphilus]|uniref:Transcriptional regulator n=1 Tax=Sulfodiicoccus acidiphilus TaxID=1670455 RepID=A0A348B3W7_9CREN|nr:thiamine-phosphate synthase family protein [Sulfodiicoccus acidiphilus]BBD72869.1 transcriptional regulator [Sulfodiicoccus acidiphilus]GGT88360.1 transcriptional regulator [Sulfodiicoccus acidiphilus]
MLRTPLTLLTDVFMPSLRVLAAKRLRELGMSQTRIASLVGVSQPAVRQYLDEDEEKVIERLINLGLAKEEVNELVDQVTQLLSSEDVEAVMSFVTTRGLKLLSDLRFCQFHRSLDQEVPPTCSICSSLYIESEEELMRQALAMIQDEDVSELIPQVMSNMAFAKWGAKGPNDVIAVPGRITKVHGVPRPASRPEWGASAHLAKILLRVMESRHGLRAVMNLKYDDSVERALLKLGLPYVKVRGESGDDDVVAREIAEAMTGEAQVALHLGGRWLEPATYVFGRDPLEVAKRVLGLAREYVKLRSKRSQASK